MKTLLSLILAIAVFITSSCLTGTDDTKKPDNQTETTHPSLFLLSKGLKSDTLKEAFVRFIGQDPAGMSVAVVVNASSSDKKKNKKTRKVREQFAPLGFDTTKIALFDLMKTPPKKLADYDLVYILGGNPFLLLDEAAKSGALPVLKEFGLKGKKLMGYSAGSLLLGPDMSLMNYADPLLGFNELGLTELTCVGLYDFHIFPHYRDFTAEVPELADSISAFEAQASLPVYRLNDNQGILYENGKAQIIGK